MKKLNKTTIWASILTLSLASLPAADAAKLSETDLAKKKEGSFFTGLPLVNYSSDSGFGYGLRTYWYDNGERSDEHFDETPYFVQSYAQFFQTTAGQSVHELFADMPYFLGSDYRIQAVVSYFGVLNANYHGIGAEAADAGLVDSNGAAYDSAADYTTTFLESSEDPNQSLLKYDRYQREQYIHRLTATTEILDGLDFIFGYQLNNTAIVDWAETKFSIGDDDYISAPTRFSNDQADLIGADGGWSNMLLIGFKLDQRDFEPNPKSGYLVEYYLELSNKAWLSDYNFARQSFGGRVFYTFWDRLTLGSRIHFSGSLGDAPFYELSQVRFYEGTRYALGGNRTARGYPQERFIAKAMSLYQFDIRGFIGDVEFWGQRFGLQPFAFVDLGNVYDSIGDIVAAPRFGDMKISYGGGAAIPWNLSTIIHVFMGISDETSTLSINFNHAF